MRCYDFFFSLEVLTEFFSFVLVFLTCCDIVIYVVFHVAFCAVWFSVRVFPTPHPQSPHILFTLGMFVVSLTCDLSGGFFRSGVSSLVATVPPRLC